jgi:uncharacterized membrane-anchored protein YhcB (DUF1043 family)
MQSSEIVLLVLNPAISAVVTVVVSWLLNRDTKVALREQGREIATLKDERVAKLENHVEALQASGCSVGQVVQTKLEIVIGQNNEILRDLKKLDRENGALQQHLAETSDHLQRLHATFDVHRDNRELHRG